MGKEMKQLREQLWKRCRGYCELCGKPLPESWALHHRKLKSQGGKDEIVNVVALHHECHNLGTNSVHLNPAWSKERGFIVSSWLDPSVVSILYKLSDSVLLLSDGGIEAVIE